MKVKVYVNLCIYCTFNRGFHLYSHHFEEHFSEQQLFIMRSVECSSGIRGFHKTEPHGTNANQEAAERVNQERRKPCTYQQRYTKHTEEILLLYIVLPAEVKTAYGT